MQALFQLPVLDRSGFPSEALATSEAGPSGGAFDQSGGELATLVKLYTLNPRPETQNPQPSTLEP